MPQTLTQIKQLLAAHGLRPKHRLGQNFLHDHNQLRRIMAAASVAAGDVVLEVGPGTGALTQWLLEAGASVAAVEVDAALAAIVRQQLSAFGERLVLVVGDVLAGKHAINPQVYAALRQLGGGEALPDFKLIANLPYQVASPLLINLVAEAWSMRTAVVMVQKEVAERMRASPGGKDFGPLTVMLQAYCEVALVGTLSPGCFWPRPEVDSAVVRLSRRAVAPAVPPGVLSALLQKLFRKRRKQIGSILGRDAALPAGVTATMRPEQLSVAQLVALAAGEQGLGGFGFRVLV